MRRKHFLFQKIEYLRDAGIFPCAIKSGVCRNKTQNRTEAAAFGVCRCGLFRSLPQQHTVFANFVCRAMEVGDFSFIRFEFADVALNPVRLEMRRPPKQLHVEHETKIARGRAGMRPHLQTTSHG